MRLGTYLVIQDLNNYFVNLFEALQNRLGLGNEEKFRFNVALSLKQIAPHYKLKPSEDSFTDGKRGEC